MHPLPSGTIYVSLARCPIVSAPDLRKLCGACLTIWIDSLLLSLLLRDVAIPFCASRPLVCVSQFLPIFTTPRRATPLSAAHRHGHEEHNEHNCYGDHDHNDSCRYRHRDQQGAAHSVFLQGVSPGRNDTRRDATRT